MHLVVGATGLVGGAVAQQLRKQACDVRALVRGGAAHQGAKPLAQAGVSIVAGDLLDPVAVGDACKGVDTVVCTATSMPAGAGDALRRVDQDGVLGLIAAAELAGVRRFVYTSFSPDIRADSPLRRAKRSCEARLAASAMQSVVLQPSRRLRRSFSLEHVGTEALEMQHQSGDPLQQTFAALMLAYALGDSVPNAQQTADRYGVTLTTLEDYANRFHE